MCHIILGLPFVSLVLFFVLPFSEALPSFLAVNAVSFLLYYKIYVVMREKPQVGKAAMIGSEGTVIDEINSEGRIAVGNEIWFATSNQRLHPGQKCIVVGFDGLRMLVESKS